jgi:hypothetical protein
MDKPQAISNAQRVHNEAALAQNSSEWLKDNVVNPFITGTGVRQIAETFTGQHYEPRPNKKEHKPFETAVQTVSSTLGAIAPYIVLGKFAHGRLGALAERQQMKGLAGSLLRSETAANLGIAGAYEFLKTPTDKKQTRIGNATGAVLSFGAFEAGNHGMKQIVGLADTKLAKALLTVSGRALTGSGGAVIGYDASNLVAGQTGGKNTANNESRMQAAVFGAVLNEVLPVAQLGAAKIYRQASPLKSNLAIKETVIDANRTPAGRDDLARYIDELPNWKQQIYKDRHQPGDLAFASPHPNGENSLHNEMINQSLPTTRSLGLSRRGAKEVPAQADHAVQPEKRADNLVRTNDPERFLIRISTYSDSPRNAAKVEQIIGNARNAVLEGRINSARRLEKFISSRYIREFHPYIEPPIARVDKTTGLARPFFDPWSGEIVPYRTPSMPRHESYAGRALQLVGKDQEHLMTAKLNGQEVEFVRTMGYDLKSPWLFGKPWWQLPENKQTFDIAGRRSEQLWSEVVGDRALPPSAQRLAHTVNKVAEMEWLGAQTWKYYRGGAGTAQAVSRSLLEISGIDSGRFKPGVDPNLEALTTPLPQYIQNYIDFFERKPFYFK